MKKIFYGWWIVGACFLIMFYVAGVIFYGFTAFFEPIRREFGWSYAQISFAASLRGLEMGIFAPIVGFLVDRLGSRRLILLGTIVVGFGLILLSQTQSLVMFYCSFLLIAFGAGGLLADVPREGADGRFEQVPSTVYLVVRGGDGGCTASAPALMPLAEFAAITSPGEVAEVVAVVAYDVDFRAVSPNEPGEVAFGVGPASVVFLDEDVSQVGGVQGARVLGVEVEPRGA